MRWSVTKAVVFLDMVLLLMTASWVLFGISRGIGFIELIYNYIYIIISMLTLLLNIMVLKKE